MRPLVVAVAFLAGIGSPALGQSVGDRRFDPVTGDYFVLVMNDALELVEMRVVPPNKVLASLLIRIDRGELQPLRYVYTVRVQEGTQQRLRFLQIDCPASPVMEGIAATAIQNGIPTAWNAEQVKRAVRLDATSINAVMNRSPLPAHSRLYWRRDCYLWLAKRDSSGQLRA